MVFVKSAVGFKVLLILQLSLQTLSSEPSSNHVSYKKISSLGQASQSDDYAYWYSADKAIDGRIYPFPEDAVSNSVSMTMASAQRAWWKLEFKKKVFVVKVDIYNRQTRTGAADRYGQDGEIDGAILAFSSSPYSSIEYSQGEKVYSFENINLVSNLVTIYGGATTGRLQLAEVEVYGGERFCTGLTDTWVHDKGLVTKVRFPVISGQEVEVECRRKIMTNTGSQHVVCEEGTRFQYSAEPRCVAKRQDDKFDPLFDPSSSSE